MRFFLEKWLSLAPQCSGTKTAPTINIFITFYLHISRIQTSFNKSFNTTANLFRGQRYPFYVYCIGSLRHISALPCVKKVKYTLLQNWCIYVGFMAHAFRVEIASTSRHGFCNVYNPNISNAYNTKTVPFGLD